MNKDQMKGLAKQAKGGIKEVTGQVTDNKTLEAKGKPEKSQGKVQPGSADTKAGIKSDMKAAK